jgi:hypothetical protein
MPWQVGQAKLDGGGWFPSIMQADDGTLICTYDGGNAAYIRDEAAARWVPMFLQSKIPTANSQAVWGQGNTGSGSLRGIACPALAIAPSNSNYLYAVVRTTVGLLSGEYGQIWRSTDKGASWTNTGKFCGLYLAGTDVGNGHRGGGPPIAVDPNNHLHVLVSAESGVIYRTTDGFDTMTCLHASGGPLDGSLGSAVTTAATANGGTSLTFGSGTIPSNITSPTSGYANCRYLTVVNDNEAIKNFSPVVSTTATSVNISNSPIVGNGVEIGDLVVFGGRAGIAFDRTSAVVNGITQGVYIGWNYGSTAIYQSTDGCATFSAMSGSPATSVQLHCSRDGVLYVLPWPGTTATPANYPCRYVTSTSTSGLTLDTWTTLSTAFSEVTAGSNYWFAVTSDPLNPGRVAVARNTGALRVSSNYGATQAFSVAANTYTDPTNGNIIQYARTSADAPELGPYVLSDGTTEPGGTSQNAFAIAQMVWDNQVSNRLWICEGIGMWYVSPPTSGTNISYAFTGFNKGQNSLILNRMIKAPGGTLLTTGQDRGGFRLLDPNISPTGNFQVHTGLSNPIVPGWGIDYARTDKNFLVLATGGGIWHSTNEGKTFTKVDNTIGDNCAVACQSPTNYVIFTFSGAVYNQYTVDGRTTAYQRCNFDGVGEMTGVGWGWQFGNKHMVCADENDPNSYYAYSVNATESIAGTWRSTDNGVNWYRMGGPIAHPTIGGRKFHNAITGQRMCFRSIPGYPGHLLFSPGTAANGSYPLMYSTDHGATWSRVGGASIGWTTCIGAAAPGSSFYTIYKTGFDAADADPNDGGVFYCTDFDPSNTTAATFTRICRAPGGNMDPPRDLCADMDRFGRWFMPNSSSGYAYGEIGSRTGATLSFGA